MNDSHHHSQMPEKEAPPFYTARKKIYMRSVTGRFQNWRVALVVLILGVFYILPWLTWNGRPMVLLDIAARKFYFFGVVFWPQDVIYLTAILIISAYALFLFTAIAGRLFCGYACPQTVYTELLMWIEHAIEGDRNARMKLDAAPWSSRKIGKKIGKHIIWILTALWSGITFVGYFVPIRTLLSQLPFDASGWSLVFIFLFGMMVYLFAGIMREQVCKYMCPYARFQSVMFDHDTMIVTYDAGRGEPRGAHSKKKQNIPLGDCVDCALCVHVCPTGIDIRDGLQYECIGCGACIDACDSVMKKMNLPVGLVRYATENGMKYGYTKSQIRRKVFRPRILVYIGILAVVVAVLLFSLLSRNPLRVDVLRDRGVMAREAAPGQIENVYRLQIMNTEEAAHTFRIKVEGLPGIRISDPVEPVALGSGDVRMVPVAVRFELPRDGYEEGMYPILFIVEALDKEGMKRAEKSTFMVPNN